MGKERIDETMELLKLKDGNDICTANNEQFADLVREYMGNDSADYFNEVVRGYNDRLNDMQYDIDSIVGDIDSVGDKLADKDGVIDELNEEIEGLEKEIRELEEKLSDSDGELLF